MKRLTENEIKFIKETGVTWTVVNCDEWKRTSCANIDEARKVAEEKYQFNLDIMLNKFNEYDGISLEYTATYLFYTFFTKEELEKLTPAEGLEWLQDMKYFCGFRKWDEGFTEQEIYEAIEVYNGVREFYEWEDDREVWNREISNSED